MRDKDLDFMVVMREQPPAGYPGDLLNTDEANLALREVYKWACSSDSIYAQSAKVYVEAIPMNREYDPSSDRADKTQLLYVMANTQHWRGETAKKTKSVLNEYIESLSE